MFLMASAANLLMAYLALEFVSLTSYVLTGHLKNNRRSGEAALKYLIFGGVASGAMIYGMSWLFGLTGAMDYAGIAAGLAKLDAGSRGALFVALLLVLSGFGYKIAAVPFHMWAPDVYTGAPLPVTAFLAVGSKAAGFAMLLRFFAFGVTPEGPSAVVTSIPLPAAAGGDQRRHHDPRQPGGAPADQHEAPAGLLLDRARRLRAARPRRLPPGRPATRSCSTSPPTT